MINGFEEYQPHSPPELFILWIVRITILFLFNDVIQLNGWVVALHFSVAVTFLGNHPNQKEILQENNKEQDVQDIPEVFYVNLPALRVDLGNLNHDQNNNCNQTLEQVVSDVILCQVFKYNAVQWVQKENNEKQKLSCHPKNDVVLFKVKVRESLKCQHFVN